MSRSGFSKSVLFLAILLFTVMTVSCGSGGGDSGDSTVSALTTAMTLEASPDSIEATPGRSCTIKATMTTAAGTPVPAGTYVTFTTTLGTFGTGGTQIQAKTIDASGVAGVSLIAGGSPGTAVVTARSNNVSQQVSVTFTATSPVPSSLTLSLSKTTVLTGASDSAAVTATVKDQSNALLPGVTVSFSADSGQLDASSAQTGETGDGRGKAAVTFSTPDNKANRLVAVTARAGSLTTVAHVQTRGTEVLLSASTTNLKLGEEPVTLTVSVRDADASPVTNAPVTLTAEPAGRVALSAESGTTDSGGDLQVLVTALTTGAVTITAESLGARGSLEFRASDPTQDFSIREPKENPTGLLTGTNLVILVKAPTQRNVQFATTFGTFTGSRESGQVIVEPVSTMNFQGESFKGASAVFRASEAGVATVLVSDAADPSVTDSLRVVVSAAAASAARISLQTNSRVVEPSTGGVTNSALLRATVWNTAGQVVPGVPVLFTLDSDTTTGGGEYVSPVIAYTDDAGRATATFTAGSVSSGNRGVKVIASVLGKPSVPSSAVEIIIGGAPGSISISRGSKIVSVTEGNDTYYALPMAVLVTDASGKGLSGVPVTLSAWPSRWAVGYWFEYEEDKCEPVFTCTLYNEDDNRNGQMEPGEDLNGDGMLTPPATAAGSVPGTVTTGADGTAVFDLVYLKNSAAWIEDEITASTLVFGTETRSTLTFWLPYLEDEQCDLPNSPYKTKSVILTAVPSTLYADGVSQSAVTATVTKANGRPADDGEIVQFAVTSGRGSVSPTSAVTVNGVATTTYTVSRSIGTETVTAGIPGSPCAYDEVKITVSPYQKPTADFDYQVIDNNHVYFTNKSSTPEGTQIVSWFWEFCASCDPKISREEAPPCPVRFCLGPGSYCVSLTVTNDLGATDKVTKVVTIPFEDTMPTADFSYEDLGDADHVVFNDTSSAVAGTWLTDWHWTFQSGTPPSSDLQFPGMVSFGAPGNYFVTLTVTNNRGESHTVGKAVSTGKDKELVVMSADFVATDLGDGDRVQFLDDSFITEPNVIISWSWTFENGTPSVSTVQHPGTVSFGAPGIYLVTLTITADTGLVRSVAQSVMVTTESPIPDTKPDAKFISTDMNDREHILYADDSDPASGTRIVSWDWTFVGGTPGTSAATNPGVVSYATGPGWYETRLTVTNNFGESDEVVKAVEVGTDRESDPTADFIWTSGGGNTVAFTNMSMAAPGTTIVKQEWDFGDGDTSTYPGTVIDLNHTYAAPGEYLVTLTVTNNIGGVNIGGVHTRGKIVTVPVP